MKHLALLTSVLGCLVAAARVPAEALSLGNGDFSVAQALMPGAAGVTHHLVPLPLQGPRVRQTRPGREK